MWEVAEYTPFVERFRQIYRAKNSARHTTSQMVQQYLIDGWWVLRIEDGVITFEKDNRYAYVSMKEV